MSSLHLPDLVKRLANRDVNRTEATVQSDIYAYLLVAPLQLHPDDVQQITLESPVGQRRRIDVEVGATIIEVKRDLRKTAQKKGGQDQLRDYLADRATAGGTYVGVLTDGCEWRAYHLVDGGLVEATSYSTATNRDPFDLADWLDGALATVDKVLPSPAQITTRLGAKSSAHALDLVALRGLFDHGKGRPSVKLKRELWAKLVTAAHGTTFEDTDDLFLEHTLLVITAEIIAHAVVGIDVRDQPAAALLSGETFRQAAIQGVVEHDFFDWPLEVDGGLEWVAAVARRLARFDWSAVEHDVMKVLYESVIAAEVRHQMGEYYTPDWLAQRVVEEVVTDPLSQRVLDPACGSGTFLFQAVRHYFTAAEQAGMALPEAVAGVTERVLGLEVHPVAVAFARVTYLLAIGQARLTDPNRPAIAVPVYLGDSLQRGQTATLFDAESLTVPTVDGAQLFADVLKFPERVLVDAGQFDRLVEEMSHLATNRERYGPVPTISATLARFGVHPDDETVVTDTFGIMCSLHDDDRNHIWGYYVRNLARPAWLARPANNVDVLVGNPPWLAYRYMTPSQQEDFRVQSTNRQLWSGRSVATNQDLSTWFVVRSANLYLKTGGSFGMILPEAVLTRTQHSGFRGGSYGNNMWFRFEEGWSLHGVKPSFFPVPGCVVTGVRVDNTKDHTPLVGATHKVAGRLPEANMAWTDAAQHLRWVEPQSAPVLRGQSKYASRFTQGATIVPRALHFVEDTSARAVLGVSAGRAQVKSVRSSLEKRPWKDVPSRSGSVEQQFVRRVHLGSTILPHRVQEPFLAIVPHDGKAFLDGGDSRIDRYPGLAEWWRSSESIWLDHRSSDRMTLADRVDFRSGISGQLPAAPHRVVYSKSGVYLAAAYLDDATAVIDHKLYWATVSTAAEARYLTAVLNSPIITERVRPLQGRGEHNPRDIDKYVWKLPIPIYDASIDLHQTLVGLAEDAEVFVAALDLPDKRFETQRKFVRAQLRANPIGKEIDAAVEALIPLDGDA